MPQGDKTGPRGEGAKTGRQMGGCDCAKPVDGADQGFGRGRGRPCRCRRVRGNPCSCFFKPAGIKASELDENILELPEFEAIRLVDFKQMSQGEAGKQMKISQPTLSRVLESGRKKIADAIVNGKAIKIE